MKKFVSFFLSLMMLLSLAACSEGGLSFKPGGSSGESSAPETSNPPESSVIEPDEDGVAIGFAGDTLRTAFFEMTIDDPYTCDEYEGLTPNEGYKFLVADLTLYNHTAYVQPMFDTDFEVLWDLDDDDAWAWPECDEVLDENGETQFLSRSDKQIPVEFELGIHKTQTGVLLYQVPVESKEYFIAFYEVFAAQEEGGEPEYGDSFYVRFSE